MKFFFCRIPLMMFILWEIFSLSVNAQDYSHEIGQVSMDELKLDKCPFDASAEAYVLFDIGSARFVENTKGGLDIIFERKTRIKIFNENGYPYANVAIPLYQENNIYEKVIELEGATYNLNNGMLERTALDPKTVFNEKQDESIMLQKFAMPNVKAGSVIEFHYEVQTPYLFNLPDWTFQRRIPVKFSEYITRMVPFYDYQFVIQGVKKLSIYNNYVDKGIERTYAQVKFNDNVYEFALADVPAFRDESYITTVDDYIMKIDFQLAQINYPDGTKVKVLSTWEQLIKEMGKYDDFGKYLKSCSSLAKTAVASMPLEGKSPEEKIRTISSYVKSNFKWDGDDSKYSDKSFKKFMEEKSGNSADINLYMVSLMNAAGLEAYPVLLSTRDHGAIKTDYPFLRALNYVICATKVNGKYYLSDATDPYCSIDNIPLKCINNKGLVFRKDLVEWIPLNIQPPSRMEEHFDIQFMGKEIKARLKVKATAYNAYNILKEYSGKPSDLENAYLKNGYRAVDSIVFPQATDDLDSVEYTLDLTCPVEESPDNIFFSSFLNEAPAINPLKATDRNYPVDFGFINQHVFTANIHLPQGYTVQSLPIRLYYDNKDYFVSYDALVRGDMIVVNGSYMFKKLIYGPSEYKSLRFIMQDIVKKFNEKIVLKKS